MLKTKNEPHMLGPEDVLMDSCQNFPYAYGNVLFEITSRGFSGSVALNSWKCAKQNLQYFVLHFFLADHACIGS
jgi:hypothetical protein